jgi:hypothetical protein
MGRRGWTAFAGVQLVGVIFVWTGPHILTVPGPLRGSGPSDRTSPVVSQALTQPSAIRAPAA